MSTSHLYLYLPCSTTVVLVPVASIPVASIPTAAASVLQPRLGHLFTATSNPMKESGSIAAVLNPPSQRCR